MSDSFADLWSSTAPAQAQKPVPLSQQKPSTAYPQPKSKHDVFALLSQTSTTTGRNSLANSRPASALNLSSAASRPITPSLSSGAATSRPGSSLSSKLTADVFEDLFTGSFGGASSTKSMTIAERAALAEKQRLASQSQEHHAAPESHRWAGLDVLGGGPVTSHSTSSSQHSVDHDDWGLDDFAAAAKLPTQQQPQRAPKHLASDSLLDFGDFDTHSTVASPKASAPIQSKATLLWDLDDFASGSSDASVAKPAPQTATFDSPDFDFDFGGREDKDSSPSNKSVGHQDEDDILGMLSKPVESVWAQNRSASLSSSRRPAPRAARPSSPPPHVLGQIVEMGFSIQQAKSALAKTESGIDVQAALDMLLGDPDGGISATTTREAPIPRRPPPGERRYNDVDEEEEAQFAASSRRSQSQREHFSDVSSTPNLQVQADKILAQASEIGFSVLTKASLFWKEGKEKVQKVYEERAASAAGSTDRGFPPRTNNLRDTRPKWMQDAAGESGDDSMTRKSIHAFKDDHDDEEESGAFRDQNEPLRAQRGASGPSRVSDQPQPEVDLFSSSPASQERSEPKVYVSPFRRNKPTTDTALSSSSAPPNTTRTAPSKATPPPAPHPKSKRRLPSCAETTLVLVRQHRTKGTDAFKLGQYSVAVEEYSKAITMLPSRHLLLIPLHTNRALAKIRCGECKGAVEDAGEALGIVGNPTTDNKSNTWETWQPSHEDGGWELDGGGGREVKGGYGVQREKGAEWGDAWGRGVELKDGWIKAVRRRAEALEGMEKWSEARKDWEVLTGAGWVDSKNREEAVRGLGRCKKMMMTGSVANGLASSSPVPNIRPRPKPTPTPTQSNAAPSVAAKAYRAQVSAMEAEDALKHQLKDTVEARLLAWKKGKETNLRALLASLDSVLWEEVIKDMGGKPGLADLVGSGGVKKWYMKSVSKVHPDKLNANNSSVEQRMIAGGVFGALNEAWLAFKQ